MAARLPYIVPENDWIVEEAAPRSDFWGNGAGLASLAIGFVSISIYWLPLVTNRPEELTFMFGAGIVATLVGFFTSSGLILKRHESRTSAAGFLGMLMGIATLILGACLYALGYALLWG